MAVSWLRRLASGAPVPVFVAVGEHGEAVVPALALAPGIEPVLSPRHASLLLVSGGIPPDLHNALRRVHDQLPRPFATVWFRSTPLPERQQDLCIDDPDHLVETLVRLHRGLMTGTCDESPALLADVPPSPWQGVGPHGQGGEGMMGGVPYGRPMAMNMQPDLRDGLTLDSLTFRLGPFFAGLPPGMVAQLTLQGDLIQSWRTLVTPYPRWLDPGFFEALEKPVPIAALEVARARYHLYRLFEGVKLAGSERLSHEVLRLMSKLSSGSSVAGLRRHLLRSGFFRAAEGQGALGEEQARRLGGIAARASGIRDDLRSADPHYRELGFECIVHTEGDNRARWQQLLDEVEQALHLARSAEAKNMHTGIRGCVETPRGPWREQSPDDVSGQLGDLMPGLEWGEALATLATLDTARVSPWPREPAAGRYRKGSGPEVLV